MNISSSKWRVFLSHFGSYLIVITILAIINFSANPTDLSEIWFVFPALGWGAAVAIHLLGLVLTSLSNISGRWRSFLNHFGVYTIIITMLAGINLFTDPWHLWFQWPAMGWGAAVAIHLLGTALNGSQQDEGEQEKQAPEYILDKRERPQQSQPLRQSGQFKPRANRASQAHLDKAHAYKAQIEEMIRLTSDSNSRTRLRGLMTQLDEWIAAVEELALRIDRFQENDLIHQDLDIVPKSIRELKARLAQEPNTDTQTELKRLLLNRENQMASLEHLQQMMSRAELQIESTVSSLGTIYSQLLTGQSTNHVADYGRLSANVDEEVRILQDQLDALEEVKLGRSEGL